ncbi:hypothetical protein [Streptomyces sp. NPDC050856]|uniref:hypothetical protein n=1 Tax=Streptomyces sp. NPDC050856 TaxID=3154939 RepID=UPI0033D7D03D
MNVPKTWRSVNISLAVTKRDIDAASVSETLGLGGTPSGDGGVVHSGPYWWSYTYEERPGGDHGVLVAALVEQVRARLDRVEALRMAGHAVEVAVAGTVETNAEFRLAPRDIGALASLGLPVSCTSLTIAQEPEEDPLDWLDG